MFGKFQKNLLRRVFDGGTLVGRNVPDVEAGDRFVELSGGVVWTVDRPCVAKTLTVPHVIIERDHGQESKIISVAALRDRSFYRRDRRNPERENESGQGRRRTDPPKLH